MPICAARQGTARAKRSSMSKSPAATRNQSTFPCDRIGSSSHSPAQAQTRTIASVGSRSGSFHFDDCPAGTHTHTHEASPARVAQNTTNTCGDRDGAAQRPGDHAGPPRCLPMKYTGCNTAASRCIRDRHPASHERLHALRHCPTPTRSDPLGP